MTRWFAFLSIVITVLMCGCVSEPDQPLANRAPKTFFWLFPDSTIREGNSRQRVRWWGEDADGVVKGYLFASGKILSPLKSLPDPDTITWIWRTKTDSLIAFPLLVRRDTFDIAVRAVDNTFPLTLPEHSHVRMVPQPYWDVNMNGMFDSGDVLLPQLSGAIDPLGATQPMPLRNQAPSIAFALNPNDPTITIHQPETTFTAATFAWTGTDPDGDQTIASYTIALNDTSDSTTWYTVGGNVKLVSILVPPSRLAGATRNVSADVYTGTFLTTTRKLPDLLPGLLLDTLNTFYVRAVDVAGDASGFIALPDPRSNPRRTWFVRKPRAKLLIVSDYISNVSGDSNSVLSFYKTMLSDTATFGSYSRAEVMNIARGVGAQEKKDSRISLTVPPFIDPALIFTLQLFDVVLWYTDPYPSLAVAQFPLYQYIRNPERTGRVIYSTMFETAVDPRGALKDFAPIDSISSVDISSQGRFIPTLGDNRIPGDYVVLPDSTDASNIYPPLRFNSRTTGSHSLFMRPIYKRPDSRYIYRMQEDERAQIRYTYLATLSDLRGVATVGSMMWACGNGGTLLRSTDAGASWKQSTGSLANTLHSIQFLDENTGFSFGGLGTILKSEDGGDSWMNKSVLTIENLLAGWFSSANHGVVTGTKGLIIRSSDGGATWNSARSGTGVSLNAVHFADDLVGLAVGDSGVIIKTTDGGATWSRSTRPTARKLTSVRFATPTVAVAVGLNGTIIRSTDAGTSWSVSSSPVVDSLRALHFTDPLNGRSCGANGIVIRTSDGGVSWDSTLLRTPVYQVTRNGQTLNALHYTPLTGWTAVGTGGVIINRRDGDDGWKTIPKGNLNVAVVDGSRRFVFLGLPLHLLNGDGMTAKNFLQHVFFREFGLRR